MSKWIKAVIISLSFLLVGGCSDKVELEEQAYVTAIGLDKEKDNKIGVTFQISNPEVSAKGSVGQSQEKPKVTATIKASNFVEAKDTVNAFISREISLEQARVLLVSEELARSDDFLGIIQPLSKSTDMQNSMTLIVTKEKVKTFLKNNEPEMETRPHKYYQFMINRAEEEGIIPPSDVHRFFQITEGDADLYLAPYATSELKDDNKAVSEDEYVAGGVPQEGGNTTQFMGSAVFKEGKMIDVLTGEETRISLILDKTLDMKDVLVSYPDPKSDKHRVTSRFSLKEEPDITIQYNKDAPTTINVDVPVQLELLAVPSLVDYSPPENRELLERSITEALNKKAEKFIEKTQKKYKADPFYWSLYIRHYFKTINEYEQADWSKKIYPNADITVNYDVQITKFGKALKESNLDEIRD